VFWERQWTSTDVEDCFEVLADIQEHLLEYEGTNKRRKRNELTFLPFRKEYGNVFRYYNNNNNILIYRSKGKMTY